jgi:RNA polymerase sigma-70 factor (ECF subfamily)
MKTLFEDIPHKPHNGSLMAPEPTPKAAGRESSNRAFEQLAEPLRREIKLHCYRMLGSLHEAEDAVQETYLRAWRHFQGFEGGSFRAWLYQIGTNVCLDALASRKRERRVLPDQLGPAAAGMPNAAPPTDVPWLEPYPDSELDGIADDTPGPEARYASREAVQIAFVAAIQQLPPRQRVMLLLCDVLGWSADEAATLIGGTTASVNSALQRARETLSKRYPHGRPALASRPNPDQQKLLDRYLKAWEGHDLDGFVSLLKEDAAFTMPPWLEWYSGRSAIRDFFEAAWKTCGGLRLVPIAANRQPGFAVYERTGVEGQWAAHSIHLLQIEDGKIAGATLFVPPEGPRLFQAFGLPTQL